MHIIRPRRFSSVRFWHLVLVLVLLIGQINISTVRAQETILVASPSATAMNYIGSVPLFANLPIACPTSDKVASSSAQASESAMLTKVASSTILPLTPTVLLPNRSTVMNESASFCHSFDSDADTNNGFHSASNSAILANIPNPTTAPIPEPNPTLAPNAIDILEPSPNPTPKPKVKPIPTGTRKPELRAETTSESTPAPAAAPIVAPADLEGLFQQHASTHGISADIMKKIAQCESGMRPEAANGPYGGMFQFNTSTWMSNRRAMGKDPDPKLRFNAAEAIETAAFKMGRDGYGAWPACSRKALASA